MSGAGHEERQGYTHPLPVARRSLHRTAHSAGAGAMRPGQVQAWPALRGDPEAAARIGTTAAMACGDHGYAAALRTRLGPPGGDRSTSGSRGFRGPASVVRGSRVTLSATIPRSRYRWRREPAADSDREEAEAGDCCTRCRGSPDAEFWNELWPDCLQTTETQGSDRFPKW